MTGQIAKTMQLVKEYYQTKVKPYMEEGNIPQARRTMTNLHLEIETHFRELYPHSSGDHFMIRAESMLEDLKADRIPADWKKLEFEAFLAQACLSTASGNRPGLRGAK